MLLQMQVMVLNVGADDACVVVNAGAGATLLLGLRLCV